MVVDIQLIMQPVQGDIPHLSDIGRQQELHQCNLLVAEWLDCMAGTRVLMKGNKFVVLGIRELQLEDIDSVLLDNRVESLDKVDILAPGLSNKFGIQKFYLRSLSLVHYYIYF